MENENSGHNGQENKIIIHIKYTAEKIIEKTNISEDTIKTIEDGKKNHRGDIAHTPWGPREKAREEIEFVFKEVYLLSLSEKLEQIGFKIVNVDTGYYGKEIAVMLTISMSIDELLDNVLKTAYEITEIKGEEDKRLDLKKTISAHVCTEEKKINIVL